MTWNSQNIFKVRNLVVSDKKQKAWGTAITDAELLRRVEFDSSSYAALGIAFGSDQARVGKGSSFPTIRWATDQTLEWANLQGDLDAYLAGWIMAFAMGAETVTGLSSPFTHTFNFGASDGDAIPTTLYVEDSAVLQRKFLDVCMNQAQISGSGRGPLAFALSLMGSGKVTDGAITSLPALPSRTMVMFTDTTFLIGAPGSAVAIDGDRIVSWSVTVNNNLTRREGPGSGLFANKLSIGQQTATFAATIFAKETDDLVTLLRNQTQQEIKIQVNSGAAAQLNFDFPSIFLSAAEVATQDNLVAINISSDQNSILQATGVQPLTATVLNSQASYLTLAA
jgi:Uri superfamily endonuclease